MKPNVDNLPEHHPLRLREIREEEPAEKQREKPKILRGKDGKLQSPGKRS